MAIVNLGIQCLGIMRSQGKEEFEKSVKNSNNLKQMRQNCSSFKDVQKALQPPIELLKSIIVQLELLDKKFSVFESASQKEIQDFSEVLLLIDSSLTREHSSKASIEKLDNLQKFLSHCCCFEKYFITIKTCGEMSCSICKPVRMSFDTFKGINYCS